MKWITCIISKWISLREMNNRNKGVFSETEGTALNSGLVDCVSGIRNKMLDFETVPKKLGQLESLD